MSCRRHANKGLKKGDPGKITATFIQKSGLLRTEINDNRGISTHDGVPSYARASVRELLGTITPRDPEVEYSENHDLSYLNMMGKTQQQAIGRMNIFSSEDWLVLLVVSGATTPCLLIYVGLTLKN